MQPQHLRAIARSGHVVKGPPDMTVQASVSGAQMSFVPLSSLALGDYLAIRYGADEWVNDSELPRKAEGIIGRRGKDVRLPDHMTAELAFLLGAYASEGHTTRATWTVIITNSVPEVLDRCRRSWAAEFGLNARVASPADRCASVIVHGKSLVHWLEHMGCGSRARDKRIPQAILDGSRRHALAFMQGLALDAYVTTGAMAKWAICVDSPGLLDDVQLLLTRLGVLHGRIDKWNSTYKKSYGEVYTSGMETQRMLKLVPFMEPEKAARAAKLTGRTFTQSSADVVPGIRPVELAQLIPRGQSGRSGRGTSMKAFAYLRDPRTRHVSRRTLERLAPVLGEDLPAWLRLVLDENWRFSPIVALSNVSPAT